MATLLLILKLYGFTSQQAKHLLEAIDIAGCHIELSKTASTKEAWIALDNALQKQFIRPSGSERHQLPDKFTDTKLRMELLSRLDTFTKPIHTGDNIPVKLLLGANETTTKERFNALIDLEKKGNHAAVVYLLGGKRDLWIDYEDLAKPLVIERVSKQLNIPISSATSIVEQAITDFFPDKTDIAAKRIAIVKHFTDQGITWPTESDMMLQLAKNYKELRQTSLILVDTPKKLNKYGQLVRPDTSDTFVKFWEEHGDTITSEANNYPDGKLPIAIITNQPYGPYQHQAALATLGNKPVSISVVASVVDETDNINLSVVFDSIARIIHVGKDAAFEKIETMQ